jgi:penicillin amidase
VIAVQWTALAPSTPFEAIWGFNRAQNWEDFREAARGFHVPAQNLLYADVDGNIGYQMPGDIPVRASGDGTLPVPGWTDEHEWTGLIPFEELPYTFNPAEGYIVTANNQVPPQEYPSLITRDWDYGFRARRIVEMIENAPGEIDLDYMQSMQADSYNANAPTFVPLLLQMDELTEEETNAQALLRNWDYQDRADSAGSAVFNAFWRHLLQNTFHDELPEAYWPSGGDRWFEVMRNIGTDSPWWDNTTTSVRETRQQILRTSFEDGVAEAQALLGKDPAKWSWGDMHTATFRNDTLGQSGISPVESLFNRGPFPTGGGSSIVNATGWAAEEGYEVVSLPSLRAIYDLSDLENSVTVHTTGQSGHAYHPHYIDMAPLWANVEYYPMLWEKETVTSEAEGHLVLSPK